MKTIFLLLISISCFGQMSCLVMGCPGGNNCPYSTQNGLAKVSTFNLNISQTATTKQYIGKSFVATIKEANTGLLVVCYPGSGEAFGPADGSRLSAINYGFDESIQWPFTIMKVQTIGSNNFVSWAEIQKYIDDHSTAAVVIGWSQGAREAMDLLLGFQGRKLSSKVKLVVAIDGPASGSPDYTKASVPLVMISGLKGVYYYPLKTQQAALLKEGKKVDFIQLDDLDHSGLMKYTYSAANVLTMIKGMSAPISKTPLPLKIDSMFFLNDTLFMYTHGEVNKIVLTPRQ